MIAQRAGGNGYLVSDQEREYTVGLLRQHLLAGRLVVEEFEQRVAEVWRARFAADLWHALRSLPLEAAPPYERGAPGSAVASLVIGAVAVCLLLVSFGLLFVITLPLSATAWALGRHARRSGGRAAQGAAVAGEALGIFGTVVGALLLAGCAALVAGVT